MSNFFSKNKDIISLAVILFIISAIAALSLAGTDTITRDKIADNKKANAEKAMKEIFPEAENFTDVSIEKTKTVLSIAKDEKTGDYVVSVLPVGFGGPIEMLVGIDKGMKIAGVKFITMNETPGLGTKVKDKSFIDKFIGKAKSLTVVKAAPKDQTEIDAISGATISSKAVTSGVNDALSAVQKLTGGEANEQVD